MSSITPAVPRREALHGVRQIVRFNWPFYAAGVPAALLAPVMIPRLHVAGPLQVLLYAATAVAWLWLIGSLAASWIVYDRSNLMTGEWIHPALGFRPRAWINVHAGLDETTAGLRDRFGVSSGRVFDIFDQAEMTEPSIARARETTPVDAGSERTDYRHFPVETGTVDAAFLLLSAHELRTAAARSALFGEVRRVLTTAGRVVVAEHLRDAANFIAFGPGALHFHSRRTWLRVFAETGFAVQREFSITPFVRVFILGRSA